MSAEAPWLEAPVVEDAEPWKQAPIVEDKEQPWLSAPIVDSSTVPAGHPDRAAEAANPRTVPYASAEEASQHLEILKAGQEALFGPTSIVGANLAALNAQREKETKAAIDEQTAAERIKRGWSDSPQTRTPIPITEQDRKVVQDALSQGRGVVIRDGKAVMADAVPQYDNTSSGFTYGAGTTGLRIYGGLTRLLGQTEEADKTAQALTLAQEFAPTSKTGRFATGATSAAMLLATPGGLPGMLTNTGLQSVSSGYDQGYEEARKAGKSEAEARSLAKTKAFTSTIKAVPELAAYWLIGLGASKSVAPLLKQAGPVAKTAVGATAATAANVATSSALRTIHGEEVFTPEGIAQDILFGLVHGFGAGTDAVQSEAMVRESLKGAPVEMLKEAATDPNFRKSSPYRPELIDEELASRGIERGEIKPATTEAGSSQSGAPGEGAPPPTATVVPESLPEGAKLPAAGQPLAEPAGAVARTPVGEAPPINFKAEADRIRTEWMEGRAEETKPAPVAPDVEQRLRTAHQELVKESPWGFPDVPLADLLERAGFTADAEGLAAGKSALKQLQNEGKMDLGGGDWSLATDRQRASGVIGKPGDPPAIYGKFREGASEALPELLPEQADVAAPKLDVKRSPFALGVAPDLKAVTWLTKNVKRLFTATGDLPKETFEQWIDRNGFVKEQSRKTAYATRDLYNALKEEFGISTTETLTKGFAKVPPEFVKKMNQALLGEVDINTLPERVRAPLQAMRDHVDAMSQRMLDEGVVPASLQAKVADNLGTYLTRSYRVFDDPKWAEKIPQDVRNRARDFIQSNLQKTDPNATPQTANAIMEAMLQDWKDQGSGALVKSGGKLGSKDLTSFIARKDIPKVLREVMGEYQDPSISYTRSVTKMANLIGSQRFLNQVKADGMGKFLFEDGTQPATHTALIAADGSSVMAPLNGLRTTPEIAAAFREFGKSDMIQNPLWRMAATLSGLAKSAKTVGSAMTQARNILGQAYFFAMNGHFDLRPAAGALKAVLADLGAKDTPAGREAYLRYQRLGVVDQSARASELRDIIRDSGLNDPGTNLTEPGQILARTAKKLTVDAAAKAYQVSDDLGKIIGFENELARQKSIHPEWSQTTLEATAAERIRNTYPTYSMVPQAIRNLRRIPFGPFMSFASETFRTAYHNLRYTIEDLKSSNPAQKAAGIQRLAGQLAVVGGGYALSAVARGLLGMNAQEEDDARRFMAPWDKDSQIMFTGKGPGEARYLNVSYVNPYSYLTDPLISVASGLRNADELDDVMLRSLGKLLQPFTSEDILTSAAIDTLRNTTQTGARVYNPGESFDKKLEAVMARFYNAVEPGTLTRARTKILPAIKGETDKTGRQPELTTEVLNELTGFRQQKLDYTQALGYKAREFKKADDDADSIFREVAARRGAVKSDEIADAYKRAARSKFNAWQNFYRDVQAARRRGVSDSAIRTAIEARGVSNAESGAIMSGRFVAPTISPALSKQMQANKRTTPPAVNAEKQRADKLVLSGRFE